MAEANVGGIPNCRMNEANSLEKYLREIRGEKSLGQVEIITGITKSHLSKIERGERKPSFKLLRKLAETYHIDYHVLLQRAGYIDSPPSVTMIGVELDSSEANDILEYAKLRFPERFKKKIERINKNEILIYQKEGLYYG